MIVDKVQDKEDGIGFDVVTEQYVDMMKNGIIDPVKVTNSALVNASSVAGKAAHAVSSLAR